MTVNVNIEVSVLAKDICFSNWDEWMSVRHGLFATELAAQRHALQTVSVWRQRRDVPQSVTSTADFVEIKLQDPWFCTDPDTRHTDTSLSSLRLLYSIAIVRTVNGLVDPSQQSFFAQSVLVLAEKMGLPGWVVELRHDGSHKQLPSLSVLRAAAQYLLDWLDKHYWRPQEENLQGLLRFCLLPMREESGTGAEPEAERAAWRDQLVRCCLSPSFVSDLFLPIFVDAICSSCASSSSSLSSISSSTASLLAGKDDDGVTALFTESRRVWDAALQTLSSLQGTLWIYPALARLLFVLEGCLPPRNSSNSNSSSNHGNQRVVLIGRWVGHLAALLTTSHCQQRAAQRALLYARTEFVRTAWSRLGAAAAAAMDRDDDRWTAVWKGVEASLEPLWESVTATNTDTAPSARVDKPHKKQRLSSKPTLDDDAVAARRPVVKEALKVVSFADSQNEAVTEISFCSDVPAWPIGYLPGRYECSDLLLVEEV
jgi:hypothetical protein